MIYFRLFVTGAIFCILKPGWLLTTRSCVQILTRNVQLFLCIVYILVIQISEVSEAMSNDNTMSGFQLQLKLVKLGTDYIVERSYIFIRAVSCTNNQQKVTKRQLRVDLERDVMWRILKEKNNTNATWQVVQPANQEAVFCSHDKSQSENTITMFQIQRNELCLKSNSLWPLEAAKSLTLLL